MRAFVEATDAENGFGELTFVRRGQFDINFEWGNSVAVNPGDAKQLERVRRGLVDFKIDDAVRPPAP
jgi:hypothetical protein